MNYHAFAALLVSASLAQADFSGEFTAEIQIDLNDLAAEVQSPPFSQFYTGSVVLTNDDDSVLAAVLIDGVTQPSSGVLREFEATIDFDNGEIAGGHVHVVVDSSAGVPETYTAALTPGIGGISLQTGDAFDFLSVGSLTRDTLAGVDVSSWRGAPDLCGSGLAFRLGALYSSGASEDIDFDLFLLQPALAERADLNNDGGVDPFDLAILLAAWGPLP